MMIKESADHDLLPKLYIVIWSGDVPSDMDIHTYCVIQSLELGPHTDRERQAGLAGHHLCPFSPNHKEEKPSGRHIHFHHNPWM